MLPNKIIILAGFAIQPKTFFLILDREENRKKKNDDSRAMNNEIHVHEAVKY